jgi:hypothetical protein
VVPVRRSQVGFVREPVEVRREAELAQEDEAGELTAGDPDALLADPGAGRVHGLELRVELVHPLDLGLHLIDSGVVVVGRGLGWRAGPVDLPREGDAIRGILAKEVVQDRRPGATHADHDDRRGDVGGRHVGMAGMPVGDLQPVDEVRREQLGGHRLAERVQSGLGLDALDEAVEAVSVGVAAEVLQPGALVGFLNQPLRAELECHSRLPRSPAR